VFELRRDPVTGWWSAIVTDRTFEHASFAVQATPIEGTHCRHCDDDPTPPAEAAEETAIRRFTLRGDAFHRIDAGRERQGQRLREQALPPSGSWEILVAPRGHHERLADAPPRLAVNLLRTLRDTMRSLAAEPREPDEPRYLQAVQSYGMQAGSRSSHLNLELYALPQVPHWVAEEIGGGARHIIRAHDCVWCALAHAEEEAAERLVLAEERFVVFAPAASRSAFELMIVPRAHAADFTTLDDDAIAATTATLQRTLRALDALGDPPYNLFLHTAPVGERLTRRSTGTGAHPACDRRPRAPPPRRRPAAPEYAAGVLREHLHRESS
jgi:galactose-1-phosphate uridylyltransferase